MWPEADVLLGITMQLLQAALTGIGAPWSTLRLALDGILMLQGCRCDQLALPPPLASIEQAAFPGDGLLASILHSAWVQVPWDPV
jgi:4-amino-4-deoxychorismate lyase